MRTFIKSLLAATMLIPVAAQAQDAPPRPPQGDGHRGYDRPGYDRRGGDRPRPTDNLQGARPDFRSERPQPFQAQPGARPDRNFDRPDRGFDRPPEARPDRPEGARPGPERVRPERLTPDRPAPNRLEVDTRGDRPLAEGRPDWRGGNWNRQRDDRRDGVTVHRGFDDRRPGVDDRRAGWNGDRIDRNDRPGWDGRDGDQRRWDRRGDDRGAWSRGWRDDRRYDWGRYRDGNRAAYRLPHYYAPAGWGYGYRRFAVGTTLWSGLWGSSYWIDDPFAYRLPEAYGPYRWVRYYHDALLVDVRNGRVVDVVYDIFW
ncbi:hypothetical protein D9601_07185 [Sphingomonas sp. MA1305]|uniref:RcnB family protein n=1 Tax=Sphingomonas sp. MA1305 TaxID=2479204 RepID=UPI0018DF86FF|nr:RcnB family protein [Sphingomonas sp. MA1305]MBI0475139.1 hypothetical protein [Sphingomonas sp. MA1305]